MKKIASLLLCFLVIFSSVALAETDYASMTDDELKQVISSARNELVKRTLVMGEKVVIIDQDGFSMYLTGEHRVWDGSSGSIYLELNVVMINDTEHDINMLSEACSINGWDSPVMTPGSVTAGKKKKGVLQFTISAADISTFEEVEDIELKFRVYDDKSWDDLFITDTITVSFNK